MKTELRNLIYRFYDAALEDAKYPIFKAQGYDYRSILVPKMPVLMQTSQQVRSEFGKVFQRPILIDCDDYASFHPWSQGLGLCVIGNIRDLHLSIGLRVNVVKKRPFKRSRRLAHLRIRFEAARTTYWGEYKGPSAQFCFDIEDKLDPYRLINGMPYDSYDDDFGTLWYIRPSEISRMTYQFEVRLPRYREFNVFDILEMIYWLSGDGVIDFDHPDSGVHRGWNTFTIEDRGGTRDMTAMVYPPGTKSLVLWSKPFATEGASSRTCRKPVGLTSIIV